MQNSWIIVTGATGCIGKAITESLLQEGRSVILACRNSQKGEALRSELTQKFESSRIQVEQLELESIESIEKFATRLSNDSIRVEALFNNAGILLRRYEETLDGFEKSLGVNYIAPYLLTRLLMPLYTPRAAIINTTSLTRNFVSLSETIFNRDPHKYKQLGWYAQSKKAVLFFTAELAKRAPQLRVHAVDPGVVNTGIISMDRWFDPLADLLFRPFIKQPAQGALPALNAYHCTESGELFSGNQGRSISEKVKQDPYGEWLWHETQQQLISRKVCLSI